MMSAKASAMRDYEFWVYIMASGPYGWLYVGMTNDLVRRGEEHKHAQIDGWSRDKGCDQLVWFERHQYADKAILKEKQLKRWRRPWKFALIEKENPRWHDLYAEFVAGRRPDQPDGRPGGAGFRGVPSRTSAARFPG